MNDIGFDLRNARRVLDFGCGCGRTIRWFLRDDLGHVEFHGTDVDGEAVEWCRAHLPGGHFETTDFLPPLPYPPNHFDTVYCISVFTHLDEPMQDLWLAELVRVLRPGGVLLFTVHGAEAARSLDGDSAGALRSRGFLHRRSSKLRGIVPDGYHTTWHSAAYIIERASRRLVNTCYRVTEGGQQDFVLGRKPGAG